MAQPLFPTQKPVLEFKDPVFAKTSPKRSLVFNHWKPCMVVNTFAICAPSLSILDTLGFSFLPICLSLWFHANSWAYDMIPNRKLTDEQEKDGAEPWRNHYLFPNAHHGVHVITFGSFFLKYRSAIYKRDIIFYRLLHTFINIFFFFFGSKWVIKCIKVSWDELFLPYLPN